MRFVTMEHTFSREEQLTRALAAFTADLGRQATATANLADRHSGLALDHGLGVRRAGLRRIRHAIAALRAVDDPTGTD